MVFELENVNVGLVRAWEFTKKNYPQKVIPHLDYLLEIERDCGAEFPADYMSFMSKYGGLEMNFEHPQCLFVGYSIAGNVRKEACFVQAITASSFVREWYFRMSRPDEHYAEIGPRIPPKTAPIGVTSAPDEYYLIDLSVENYGVIWRMAPENYGTWGSESNTILGLAASSFTNLLSKLITEDEMAAKGGFAQ